MGLSQSDLARALNLSFQQVQKYEKGANRVSASKLWETANFLGVEIDAFFAGLSDDSASGANQVASDPEHPPTRSSLEIERLSRQLSPRQQKLALDLMLTLLGARDPLPEA